MCAILVAKGRQLHANQGFQSHHLKLIPGGGLGHVRRRRGAVRADLLPGKDDVDRVARAGGRAVQEQIQAAGLAQTGNAPVNKSGRLERLAGRLQIGAPQENIDISRVADGRFIHARHPGGDGIAAGHRIRHLGCFQRPDPAEHLPLWMAWSRKAPEDWAQSKTLARRWFHFQSTPPRRSGCTGWHARFICGVDTHSRR